MTEVSNSLFLSSWTPDKSFDSLWVLVKKNLYVSKLDNDISIDSTNTESCIGLC